MPIHNEKLELSNTEATLIVPMDPMPQKVYVHNNERIGSRHIHLGNENMTLENSFRIDRGETISLDVGPGDKLFAMSDGNGYEVGVLRITQD